MLVGFIALLTAGTAMFVLQYFYSYLCERCGLGFDGSFWIYGFGFSEFLSVASDLQLLLFRYG